jgi:lysophospholipase L1-like esterase
VEYFLTRGYKYEPDVVVLNFFVNDAEPVTREYPPPDLMRVCYACVFVIGRIDSVARRFLGGMDWAKYYLSLYGDGEGKGWLDAKEAIHKLADYCKANAIALLIAKLPELHDVQNYRLRSITNLVREAADENGVAFFDLLPYLKDQPSSTLWVTPPDPHPNALAHKLLARGLFDALQKLQASH